MATYDDTFLTRISRTIEKHNMFSPGDSVLVGVSGGADSTALLCALVDLSGEFSLSLAVAHFNHEIRIEEADRESDFVKSLAEKLAIPFFMKKKNALDFARQNRMSLEEASRKLRYRFYLDTAKSNGFSKVALGHNSDDNAEQVLMSLVRGSGLKGLSGIPPVRQEKIVRPLIHCSRSEIEEFISRRNIVHVSDSSNQDSRFLCPVLEYRNHHTEFEGLIGKPLFVARVHPYNEP